MKDQIEKLFTHAVQACREVQEEQAKYHYEQTGPEVSHLLVLLREITTLLGSVRELTLEESATVDALSRQLTPLVEEYHRYLGSKPPEVLNNAVENDITREQFNDLVHLYDDAEYKVPAIARRTPWYTRLNVLEALHHDCNGYTKSTFRSTLADLPEIRKAYDRQGGAREALQRQELAEFEKEFAVLLKKLQVLPPHLRWNVIAKEFGEGLSVFEEEGAELCDTFAQNFLNSPFFLSDDRLRDLLRSVLRALNDENPRDATAAVLETVVAWRVERAQIDRVVVDEEE